MNWEDYALRIALFNEGSLMKGKEGYFDPHFVAYLLEMKSKTERAAVFVSFHSS